jgi:hypothetical protein
VVVHVLCLCVRDGEDGILGMCLPFVLAALEHLVSCT